MRVLLFVLLLPTLGIAQADRLARVKHEVALIDADTTLTKDSMDVLDAFGFQPDGGGMITFYHRGKNVVRIDEEVFPSYGRTLTQYYFHNDTIMLIRDREDDFPLSSDGSTLDRTRLVKQFEAAYYMWTVYEDLALEQFGVRLMSEGTCGNKEWQGNVTQLLALDPRRK